MGRLGLAVGADGSHAGQTVTLDNIQFPATAVPSADANNMDDYEEGLWTPVPQGTTGSVGSGTNTMFGWYTKLGRVIHVTSYGYITNKGSWTGDFQLGGLPFTSGAIGCAGSICQYPATVVDALWRACYVLTGQAIVGFQSGSRMDVGVPYSEIVTGYYLLFQGTYYI